MANVLLGIHCVVPQCTSTLRKVNQWKARPCPKPKHKGKTQSQCMCPEPYQFFKFPTEIKLQKLWLERVKRTEMEINNLTRVCSLHFVEGKPTRRHYFPSINLHHSAPGEDADNEEEGEEEQQVRLPPPGKIPRRREETVNLVPVEEEDDEVYEGDLTISRFSHPKQRTSDNVRVYESVPPPVNTNTVTITRVTTSTKSTSASGPQITRLETRSTTAQGEKRKISTIPPPRIQQQRAVATRAGSGSSPPKKFAESSPDDNEDFDRPYDIDVIEDDGGNDSVQARQTSSVNSSTVVTLHEQPRQGFRHAPVTIQNTDPPRTILVRPKLVPVLAVAPKTQQNPIIQPVTYITQVDPSSQSQPRKQTPVLQKQPTVPNSSSSMTIGTIIGTSSIATTAANNTVTSSSSMNTSTKVDPTKPLATYDPSKQQLQIANPVKYIQECHTRIAELVAENDNIKRKNTELETELQELQKANNDLRREIVHQTMNASKRASASASYIVQQHDQIVDNASINNGNNTAPKPRIRYVIRRPIHEQNVTFIN